jgi:hypothetical protein
MIKKHCGMARKEESLKSLKSEKLQSSRGSENLDDDEIIKKKTSSS